MKSAQRYMIFFIIVAVGISIILLPQAAQPAMRISKGTIVIDAGHGGFDGGATGRLTCVHEDALNLSVAQKLKSLFGKNGYTVVMTREDGDAIGDTKDEDMARRREIILAANADIVISIHMNKFPDISVSGPQVFFYEGSVEGETLAKLIQQELIEALDPPKQRVEHPENYFLLRCTACPSVLVECGFLSNEREEALLQDDDYQEECAKAIYRGADAYLEHRIEDEASESFHNSI